MTAYKNYYFSSAVKTSPDLYIVNPTLLGAIQTMLTCLGMFHLKIKMGSCLRRLMTSKSCTRSCAMLHLH